MFAFRMSMNHFSFVFFFFTNHIVRHQSEKSKDKSSSFDNLQYHQKLNEISDYDLQLLCVLLRVNSLTRRRRKKKKLDSDWFYSMKFISRKYKSINLLCGLYNSFIRAVKASTVRVRSRRFTGHTRLPTIKKF